MNDSAAERLALPDGARARRIGALWVAGSAAAFGAMAIFARYAYAGGAEVVAVLFLRFLLAAGLMSALVVLTGRRWPSPRNALVLALMGGVGYVGQSLCFFLALKHASAGLVALLLYLYPFIVTMLGALLVRRTLSRRRMLLVLIALAGTALTIGGDVSGQPIGIALGVSAALIYSIYILVGEKVLAQEDPLAAATVVMLAAALVFGVLALWQRPTFPVHATAWLAVLAIALVSTVIAMVGFFVGVRRLGAADAAALSTLEPVVTFLLAALFLGEAIRMPQVAGGVLILGAVVLLVRQPAQA